MMDPPVPRSRPFSNRDLMIVTGIFWAVVGAAGVLALMILLLPDRVFLALSNYLQIFTAIAGALVFQYSWYRSGGRESDLYAAAALGLWGISNIAWYGVILLGQRSMVFPSLIDMGMIGSILLLSIAFQKGLAKKPVRPHLSLGLLAACIIIPAAVITIAGISPSSIVTLLYFCSCGFLIITGLNHAPGSHPELFLGACLFALTFMIYPLREMLLVSNPVLPIIGTFVSAGFALIVIGWFPGRTPAGPS